MEEFVIVAAQLLGLLTVANATPVLATRLAGRHADWPLDAGLTLWDGRPLFGRSKTVRGIVTALPASAAAAVVLGYGWAFGAGFGALAMAGDLTSSFIKRRLGIASSGRATGLDQIPEALFPLLAFYHTLSLNPGAVVLVVALFGIGQVVVSPLMFRLGVRDHPH